MLFSAPRCDHGHRNSVAVEKWLAYRRTHISFGVNYQWCYRHVNEKKNENYCRTKITLVIDARCWSSYKLFFVSYSLSICICPVAMAYSMRQIMKSVCVCQSVCVCVCLSVCEHSHGRISWSIFTKIGTDVRTIQTKTSSLEVNNAPPSIFCPTPKKPFWAKRSWKPMQILSNPISALNGIAKIFAFFWKYGHFAHAQCKICNITLIYNGIFASQRKSGSRNSTLTSDLRAEVKMWQFRACVMHLGIIIGTVCSFIMDLAMGQTPRSTERISSFR